VKITQVRHRSQATKRILYDQYRVSGAASRFR